MLRSPLLHFLLAGAALLAVQRIGALVWTANVPPVVELRRSEIDAQIAVYQRQMRRPATREEARSIEARVVEDALWLEQARALGLQEADPVVRRRLVQNMRFLGASEDAAEQELVDRATELGMDRSDPVVRRRLIERMQALVRAGVRARPPTEDRLREHFAAESDRWREPARFDLTHVYLSRDARGEARFEDARALLRELRADPIDPGSAASRGDPFLAGHRLRSASESRITARLGPAFAARVVEEDAGHWFGPVESAFGTHLVFVHERTESRIPPFEAVRARVLEDWMDAESRRALRRELDRRRQLVEVRIIEDVVATGRGPDAREGA